MPLQSKGPGSPYKYRIEANDADRILLDLKNLATSVGGNFQTATGAPKATYPMSPGDTTRLQLQIPASDIERIVASLSTYGTVAVVTMPHEPPAYGMIPIILDIAAPP